ncbi:MAG: hypothetical protein AAGB46_06045 [Verrucomicrobiota bacterium]
MAFLDFFRRPPSLAIADCLSRRTTYAVNFPANLNGKSPSGVTTPLCRVAKEGRRYFLIPLAADALTLLDDQPINSKQELNIGQTHALDLRGHLLLISLTREEIDLEDSFSTGSWEITSNHPPYASSNVPRQELYPTQLSRKFSPPSQYQAKPTGAENSFPLLTLINALPSHNGSPQATLSSEASSQTESQEQSQDYGIDAAATTNPTSAYTCPTCWKTFGSGEIMNIAAHDDLTGDPVLGDHAKLRFKAERFNELGQAIDSRGVVSLDLACPHCRGRLPASFLSQKQIIFSLVGAPSSGKSYFLSVLLQLLPEELIRRYKCILQDGDPSGNAQLNEMKNRLFSATTPEDAFISKTDFEGLMYEKLHRNGKLVALPRPFIYHLRQSENAEKRTSLVFYDNAGEHFKPTISLDDSPGALHVAASSALFFLYDPTANREFRKALRRKRDPQLRSQATDDQDTILSEMGVRIKKLKAVESHEKVDTPLAILAGKFDVWKNLLPQDSIVYPEEGPLTNSDIQQNSEATRALLLEYCPTIVANAETISSNVIYFPVSPLGHSPKEIEDGPLKGRLAPTPRRIKPLLATVPVLWALNQVAPDILPRQDRSLTIS